MLLLLSLLLLLVEPSVGLPAQSAALKRSKKRKKGTVEARLLNESHPGGGTGGAIDFVQLATKRYLDNDELTEWLHSYEKRCKSIAKLTSIGKSTLDKCVAATVLIGAILWFTDLPRCQAVHTR